MSDRTSVIVAVGNLAAFLCARPPHVAAPSRLLASFHNGGRTLAEDASWDRYFNLNLDGAARADVSGHGLPEVGLYKLLHGGSYRLNSVCPYCSALKAPDFNP